LHGIQPGRPPGRDATIPATFALSSIALFDRVFAAFLFGAVGCLLVGAQEQDRRIEYAGYGLLTLADRLVYVVLRRQEYETLRQGGAPIREVMRHRAVVGTSGKGLRRQRWGYLIVAKSVPMRRQSGVP
jgi:hypothetical protein